MRAVGLFTQGGPEVLQIVDLPEVHAGPGEVRLRIHAATVNPTDVITRNGGRAGEQKASPPPYVPGTEAAGIIDEVGIGVPDRLKVGDAVMAIMMPKGSYGAYREQIVLDARSVVRAPDGTRHDEACTLPMNGLTARLSLDLLKLSPGQVVAVTGAAGAFGGYVVQIAKAEGLTVVADASEKDEALVSSLGADVVVRRGDDVALRIRNHFPDGVDGVADGAVLNELVIPAVRDGGAYASLRRFQGAPQRDINFTKTLVSEYVHEWERLDQLRQLVEAGKVTLRVADIYPAEHEDQTIIPAESVYAVFEAKQTANATLVKYAQEKVTSVRRLHRTSLPIPYAKGVYPPKPLIPILGGLLTFESEWNPPLGPTFEEALRADVGDGRLNLGCVAAAGHFFLDEASGAYQFVNEAKPATAFLFKLISQLQLSGTVPMIDIEAYGKWLTN